MLLTVCLIGVLRYVMGQGCSQQSISLDDKLNLLVRDNDHDNDSLVTITDVNYDVNTFYDTDHDGILTEKEWVARWSCRYGDTQYVATFVISKITQGQEKMPIVGFDVPAFRAGVPVAALRDTNQARYTDFSTKRCVDRYLTLEEKLELNAKANDYNNDGVVGDDDFLNDLTNNYDTDKDGNVTQAEWVLQWLCAYGDDGYFARYVWAQFTGGLPPSPTTSLLEDNILKYSVFCMYGGGSIVYYNNREPPPLITQTQPTPLVSCGCFSANSIAQHKANLRQVYETYAREQQSTVVCSGNAGLGPTAGIYSVSAAAIFLVCSFWSNYD